MAAPGSAPTDVCQIVAPPAYGNLGAAEGAEASVHKNRATAVFHELRSPGDHENRVRVALILGAHLDCVLSRQNTKTPGIHGACSFAAFAPLREASRPLRGGNFQGRPAIPAKTIRKLSHTSEVRQEKRFLTEKRLRKPQPASSKSGVCQRLRDRDTSRQRISLPTLHPFPDFVLPFTCRRTSSTVPRAVEMDISRNAGYYWPVRHELRSPGGHENRVCVAPIVGAGSDSMISRQDAKARRAQRASSLGS